MKKQENPGKENLPKPLARLMNSITNGNLWLYILAIAKRKKFYAYTLGEEIEKLFGFKPNKIMLYIVLYKLEAEKLLLSEYIQRRKYYKLTKLGFNVLKRGIEYISSIEKMVANATTKKSKL